MNRSPPRTSGSKRNGDRRETCVPRKKGFDDLLVLLGLARAGRVDESASWRHDLGGAFEHSPLDLREAGEVLRPPRPFQVGVAADDAKPGAGRVQEHPVEHATERQRPRRVERDHRNVGLGAPQGSPEEPHAARTEIGRDNRFRLPDIRREDDGLGARRSADVEHAMIRRRADGPRDNLRGFVLDEQVVRERGRQAAEHARRQDNRVGDERRRVSLKPRGPQRVQQSARTPRSGSDRTVTAGAALLNWHHRSAASNPCRSTQRAASHSGCDSVTER